MNLPTTRRRRISRLTRLLALAVVPVALLVAACGGGGDDEGADGGGGGGDNESACPVDALDDAEGPVEITVWSNFTALSKRTFETMVAQYNQSQDKVVVKFEPQGVSFEEVLRKYKLAAEDGKLPALALLEDTTTQVIADSGTIIPGQDCFEADEAGQEILDDFLPIAVASYSVDGVLQPVGFDVYTALVFYNRGHFAQAGLDPESPPQTLADIRAAAEKLKAAGVTSAPVAVLAASWQFEWWLTGVQQEIVNEDNGRAGLATAGTFDNEATDQVMEFWRGMVAAGLATPYPGTEGQTNQLFAMATNSASMVVESSAGVNTIAGLLEGTVDPATVKEDLGVDLPPGLKLDLDLGVGAYPGIEEPGQGQIGGGAWYLTNGGTPEQQAAAWDFMKWFNSTPQQVQWALAGSGLPVVESAAADPELQATWDTTLAGRWSEVAFGVLANVSPDFPGPLIGDYKVTREAVRNAYERVLLGDGNIDAAVTEANDAITTAAEEYQVTVGG
jgi:sn-glycerol 3-phosphate transport system substrate-binding protein